MSFRGEANRTSRRRCHAWKQTDAFASADGNSQLGCSNPCAVDVQPGTISLPDAPPRSPKGLRHGFAINATVNGIPLHLLQKWMGYAQLSMTAIYADSVGKEEQDIAARMGG